LVNPLILNSSTEKQTKKTHTRERRKKMGCDGGSIPKRSDLVKQKQQTKSSADRLRPEDSLKTEYLQCALSKRPLERPIVSCRKGRMYNKDAIVEYLLDKQKFPDTNWCCTHVKKMKDVCRLTLTPYTAAASTDNNKNNDKNNREDGWRFECPVTRRVMNGTVKFYYSAKCGCVVSEQALKECNNIIATGGPCLLCQKPFEPRHLILINPHLYPTRKLKSEIMDKGKEGIN
jgi:hypothetical protein